MFRAVNRQDEILQEFQREFQKLHEELKGLRVLLSGTEAGQGLIQRVDALEKRLQLNEQADKELAANVQKIRWIAFGVSLVVGIMPFFWNNFVQLSRHVEIDAPRATPRN
jgi:hypothetical protein